MEYQKLLFLILISFTLEFRSYAFIRKLQAESDIVTTEPETIEPETIPTFIPPSHVPIGQETTPEEPNTEIPLHNQTETEVPSTIPDHEITTIPSVISQPTYDPSNTAPSLILLVAIGNFRMPVRRPSVVYELVVVFEVYFKRIFGNTILSVRMYINVKVTYRRLRALQEGEGETEEREERATCDRITFDEDPNIKYNCSFPLDENAELLKVTLDLSTPPTFDGMSESIAPEIIVTSLANETMFEKGIQTATGNESLKTQYLMNNTILEENGLRFKLTGEMDSQLSDNQIILSFDEKGNGKIKNTTCNANYIRDNIYELDCLSEKSINAHLNGINGITTHTGEKIVIYMKPGTDDVLNTGSSNYMGLYNRGSSSGLSGGAIAGIVIACIVALIAITIGIMLCRKTNNIPAPFQESTLGVNTSNMTD